MPEPRVKNEGIPELRGMSDRIIPSIIDVQSRTQIDAVSSIHLFEDLVLESDAIPENILAEVLMVRAVNLIENTLRCLILILADNPASPFRIKAIREIPKLRNSTKSNASITEIWACVEEGKFSIGEVITAHVIPCSKIDHFLEVINGLIGEDPRRAVLNDAGDQWESERPSTDDF